LQDQIGMISTILIPLARRFTTSEILISVLSCANPRSWPDPISAPIKFATETNFPGDQDSSREALTSSGGGKGPPQEFSRKAEGLILQFCGSVPPDLALKILAALADARLPTNTHAMITEEVLHSYLTEVNDREEALSAMEKALSHPVGKSWEEFYEACIQSKSVITARVIMEQQKRYIGGMGTIEWVRFATGLVSYCARPVPNPHRDFDLWALWFFVLELLQDSRWIPTKKSEEKLHLFQRLLQIYASSSASTQITSLLTSKSKIGIPSQTPTPRMHLAARACLIYLDKILISKKNNNDKNSTTQPPPIEIEISDGTLLDKATQKRDKEIIEAVDKLLSLKSEPTFSGFEKYFLEVDNFLSPLCDLTHFKTILVQDLAPIAPYLQYF